MTPEQRTHTFVRRPRGRLFTGIFWVATGVIAAAAVAAQPYNGVLFRTLWAVGWVLFAGYGIRIALMRVQVCGGQLIVRNPFRTRTVNASEVRRITWKRRRSQNIIYSSSSTGWWAPRVHLTGGGSILLAALWSQGLVPPRELGTTVEEILSLLGVHVPVQERFPGQLSDQASAPDSSGGLPDQSPVVLTTDLVEDEAAFLDWAESPVGEPSESVGTPRRSRRYRSRPSSGQD